MPRFGWKIGVLPAQGAEADSLDLMISGTGNDVIAESGNAWQSNPTLIGLDAGRVARETSERDDLFTLVHTIAETIKISDHVASEGSGVAIVKVAHGASTGPGPTDIISTAYFGTSGNDIVTGTSLSNRIDGRGGNDTLTGGGGNDVFVFAPGTGHDVFWFSPGFGNDVITDMAAGSGPGDVIEFSTSVFADFADTLAHAAQVGADTVITLSAGNTITLQNVQLGNLSADDFRYV